MTSQAKRTPAKTHVAVLMGGLSAEREVSLSSGTACTKALAGAGFRVTSVDVGRDISEQLRALKPDVAFNALHGRFGEDGFIQGILEYQQIPYTHSGVLASALAMHKERAKIVMRAAGIPVPDGKVVLRKDAAKAHVLPRPYVLKPVDEGSSVGVFIVREDQEHPPQELHASDWSFSEDLLAERFIPGRELTCAVIDGTATDVIDIVAAGSAQFYNYEAKYVEGGSIHILPAKLLPNIYQSVQSLTLAAHHALGCRGVSRADFRLDERADGTYELACLEVNTQPGMTGTSLVPELAAYRGLSFGELLTWMVDDATVNR
jgi:D-alanine-D-alanine ligase